MKTKHYDGNMIRDIKTNVKFINKHYQQNAICFNIFNNVDYEYDGIAHFNKFAQMNENLFRQAIKLNKLFLQNDPITMPFLPEEHKSLMITTSKMHISTF